MLSPKWQCECREEVVSVVEVLRPAVIELRLSGSLKTRETALVSTDASNPESAVTDCHGCHDRQRNLSRQLQEGRKVPHYALAIGSGR